MKFSRLFLYVLNKIPHQNESNLSSNQLANNILKRLSNQSLINPSPYTNNMNVILYTIPKH